MFQKKHFGFVKGSVKRAAVYCLLVQVFHSIMCLQWLLITSFSFCLFLHQSKWSQNIHFEFKPLFLLVKDGRGSVFVYRIWKLQKQKVNILHFQQDVILQT